MIDSDLKVYTTKNGEREHLYMSLEKELQQGLYGGQAITTRLVAKV